MLQSLRGLGLAAVGLMVLAAAGCARAQPPRLRDNAGLFKSEAVANANEAIRDIKHEYGIDVVVETFKAAPRRYGRPREQAIRVLAYKEKQPGQVHVEVEAGSGRLVQKALPREAREALRGRLRAHFERQEYDAGLQDGVGFLDDTVRANLGVPFNWRAALGLILPMLTAWLVLEAVRLVIRDRVRGGDGTDISQNNGGGSVLPGLFAMLVNHDLAKVAWNGGAARVPTPLAARALADADRASDMHQPVPDAGDALHARPAEEMMRHDE